MGKKSVDKLVSGMTTSVMNASKTLLKIDGTSHHPTATAIPLTPVAATIEAPIEQRFLPGTVLKKGAKGPTVEILRERMQKLYEEGYIAIEPTVEHSAFTRGMLMKDNPIAGMEIMENEKTAALPEANTDGIHVTEFSPMFCKWEKIYDPWIRTNTDWEMILYAWQDNQLQLYIDSALGKQSQAYFH